MVVVFLFGWWGVAADMLAIASLVAAVRLGKRYRKRQIAKKGW